jgi:endonuclease-3
VLKQHYKPVAPANDRPLLEHTLYACCLENAPYATADRIYDHLSKSFFDWNEVRVSTLTELTEAMHSLPDPLAAASNLKRILQGVFESTYSFDLEPLKKQNISQAAKQLEKLGGASPFIVGYVTQTALAGHAIPLDRGALDALYVLGVISQSESQSGKVSGLERVIPKNKGIEFSSLLHQLVADYVANPFSPNVRKLMLSISPDAKDRFPKRGAKKEPEKPPEPAPAAKKKGPSEKPGEKPHEKPGERHAGKHAEKHPEKPSDKKKVAAASKPSPSKPHPVSAKRKPSAKPLAKRKPR